jgi:UDP-N-acetylglucosamine 2-epimerase (non-hydrolysing)
MSRPRIVAVVGTRPEVVKMAPVVRALRAAGAGVELVVTAQHRQLLDQALAFFRLRPDVDLDLMRPGQSPADLLARATTMLAAHFVARRPHWVLAQGDTVTVLATALACRHTGTPFAHVEAGLRSDDLRQPWPEEACRRMATTVAALHFAPTPLAAQRLLAEGVAPAMVHTTGNPVVDALEAALRELPPIAEDTAPRSLLLTTHRRESFGAPLRSICAAVRTIADRGDVHVRVPLHPNPEVAATLRRELGAHAHIELLPPFDYPGMVQVMRRSTLLLTDSGGVQEEAPTLQKPLLVLRQTTERPEGIASGVARLVGTDTETIVAACQRLLDDPAALRAMRGDGTNPYGDGRASERIADILLAGR